MKLDDYKVPDTELNVVCNMPIEAADISGENSNTATSFKGIKAKILNVKFQLAANQLVELYEFMRVAETLDDNSQDLKPYTVIDDIADAMNINQVTFYENVKVSKVPGFEAFKISFKLKEHISAAEKNAAKQQTTTTPSNQTSTNSQPVTAAGNTQPTPDPVARQLTGFEKILKRIEDTLEEHLEDDES